jgi:hypothetical protein
MKKDTQRECEYNTRLFRQYPFLKDAVKKHKAIIQETSEEMRRGVVILTVKMAFIQP